jgi:hypothetical protein
MVLDFNFSFSTVDILRIVQRQNCLLARVNQLGPTAYYVFIRPFFFFGQDSPKFESISVMIGHLFYLGKIRKKFKLHVFPA